MKTSLAFIICLLLSFAGFTQTPVKSAQWMESQFKIQAQPVTYQGKQLVSVYPALKTHPGDSLAAFMARYHRRFEYLLQNRTQFADYSSWYPDTLRMNQAYAQQLAANKAFGKYLTQLLSPLNSPQKISQTRFTQEEMMLVASRFFLCDQVRPDTTISWHVCIGLNGVKEARWDKDYTLLEAFCFEAIFDKMFSRNPEETLYMTQFLKYVEENTRKRKAPEKPSVQLLEEVKLDVFQAMQTEPALQRILFDYYKSHETTLPFKLS